MNDSGAFLFSDGLPTDHAVLHTALRHEFVERALVSPTDQLAALECPDRLVGALQEVEGAGRENVGSPVLLDLDVIEVRMNGQRHVCGEGPRGRRPNHEVLARAALNW